MNAKTIPKPKANPKLFDGLNDKQERFCKDYLKCGCNATKAALAAGYNPNSAHSTGWENLQKPEIRAAINGLLEAQGYTPEFCRNKTMAYADARIEDFEPWLKGDKTLRELELEGIDTSVIKSATSTPVRGGWKRSVVLYDGQKAVETLAKLHGMFGDDSGQDGAQPGREVTRRIVIEEYEQHADEDVDLGIQGLQPLNRIRGVVP